MASSVMIPDSMQAVVLEGPEKARLDILPVPLPGPGEVLVKVGCCLICATDIEVYSGHIPMPLPITLGHEWSGTVVAAGDALGQQLVGLRVVGENKIGCGRCELCRRGLPNCCSQAVEVGFQLPGAYAEYVLIRTSQLIPLPDQVSFEAAAFTEPVAVCLYHLRTLGVEPMARAVVVGPGPIGLICAQLLRRMGAHEVLVTGTRDNRLALAKRLSATSVVNIRQTDPRGDVLSWPLQGADLVIETSGTADGLRQAIELVHAGGRVGLLGAFGSNSVPFPGQLALDKNLTIGSTAASPGVWSRALEAIATHYVEVTPLLTHRFGLSDFAAAFTAVRARHEGLVKAAFGFSS